MLNAAQYQSFKEVLSHSLRICAFLGNTGRQAIHSNENDNPICMAINKDTLTGVILAGGKSSRMNFQNKALLTLGNNTVIEHVIAGAKSQVKQLLINANRDQEQFAALGLPVVADSYGSEAGPLAGIVTGMQWCRANAPETIAIACFPADVPFFPNGLVARLAAQLGDAATQVAWLRTKGQWQPLFSLWSLDLEPVLTHALSNQIYSPMALIRSIPNSLLDLNEFAPGEFENLNTPKDLEIARARFRESQFIEQGSVKR